MKAKEFIPASKPRNFVAKNQKTAGAGAHKDKKKAEKQGDVKHKNKQYDEGVAEGDDLGHLDAEVFGRIAAEKKRLADLKKNNPAAYAREKEKDSKNYGRGIMGVLRRKYDQPLDEPGVREGHADQQRTIVKRNGQPVGEVGIDRESSPGVGQWYMKHYASGTDNSGYDSREEALGDLRHIMKQSVYGELKQGVAEGYGTREFDVDGYTYVTDLDVEEDNRKIWHMIKTPDGKTIDVDFTPYAYMTKNDVELYVKLGMPKRQSAGPLDSEQLQKMAQIKGVAMLDPKMARAGMEEGHRDPEDWDEGNTEPANNFAVYINGKKWKVFKGRGYYADDYREKQHYQQLKAWAEKKSAETGKKWTVSITGEPATESIDEGWKEKLAAAGLAGAMALGSGNAAARVSGDEDPSINRLTGKPIATQVSPADSEKGDATSPLSSRYTSGAKWPAAYTIEYEGETYKFAGRTEAAPKGGKEIKVPAALVGIRGLGAATVTLGKDGKYYAGSAD